MNGPVREVQTLEERSLFERQFFLGEEIVAVRVWHAQCEITHK